MANQYINKVIYGNRTLIDLTGDTVEPSKVLSGVTAHDKSGAPITVYVSISANGVLEIASQPVQVSTYSVQEVLKEAHRQYCPQGEAGFADGINATYGMYMVSKVWGVETTPYIIKNSAPLGSMANSDYLTADTTPVAAGDNIIVVADAAGVAPACSLEYDPTSQLVKVQQWALDFTTFQYTPGAIEGIDIIDAETGAVLGTTNALGNARLTKQPTCGVVMYQGVGAVRVKDDVSKFDCVKEKYVAPAHDYSVFGGPDGRMLLRLLIIGLVMIVPLFIVVIFAHRKETRSGGIKYEDLRGELGKEITHKL